MDPHVVDPNGHDRFVVTRCRRWTATPSLGSVHTYDFTLADSEEPICRVRQSVTRFKENIGFYAGAARSGPLLYLVACERFDPWARYEVMDGSWETIDAIQKVFVARQQRSHYVLYDGGGDEVALVDAPLMASRSRRRAGGIAVAGAAGLVGVSVAGVPVLPCLGYIAGLVSLGTRGAIRELRERLDPVAAVSQLRITRDGALLGSYRRRPRSATIGGAMSSTPLRWGAVPTRPRHRHDARHGAHRGPPARFRADRRARRAQRPVCRIGAALTPTTAKLISQSPMCTPSHRAGRGPPLVCLHGFMMTWRDWEFALADARMVKRRAKAAGYAPELFSGHSLRSGFATTAA